MKHLPFLVENAKDFDKYDCCINTMLFASESEAKYRYETHVCVQKIINEYEREISEAKTQHEKLVVICRHVQRLEQLHPFMDGNVRLCMILLLKLLRDNGLPLSLPLNPNRLDCCSLDEVVAMVQHGQETYARLLTNSNVKTFTVMNAGIDEGQDQITCAAYDYPNKTLLNEFIEVVVNNAPAPAVLQQPATLFSAPPSNPDKTSLLALVKAAGLSKEKNDEFCAAIGKNNYSLVLRKACGIAALDIIRFLLDKAKAFNVDLHAKSSNGYTALDWFDERKSDSAEMNAVRERLVAAMRQYGPQP